MRPMWVRTLATTPLPSATSRRRHAGANPNTEVVSPRAEVNMECGLRVNLAVIWIKHIYTVLTLTINVTQYTSAQSFLFLSKALLKNKKKMTMGSQSGQSIW